MITVSGREFRANQGKYLDMVINGQELTLKLRGKGAFKIIPVQEEDDEATMSEKEFYAKIDHSLKQAEEGSVTRQHDGESVDAFIERLLCVD